MNISLALSGGAARGAFHLGVLDKFDEVGVKVHALSGASVGSFIAVAYSSGFLPREILNIIKSKEFKSIFSINFTLKSLVKMDTNSKVIQNFIKFSDLSQLPIPVVISASDLNTKEAIYFASGDIAKIVLGSCAIVPVFGPVEYEGYLLADGCFVDNLPASSLEKFKFPIVAVDLQPITQIEKVGILSSTKRALEVALTPSVKQLKADTIYITDQNLAKYSIFSFKKFDEMFEMGRAAVSSEILRNIENAKCI
ncbi:MAG: hypothetical protein GXZ15_02405 [Campylobacter sp.]|nr:hypothetical protein [Campylobacter sp.]